MLAGHYVKAIDRESAYEKLQARTGEKTQSAGAPPVTGGESTSERPQSSVLAEALGTVTAAFQPTIGPRGGVHDSFATSMAKSAMRAASSQLGRQIARGLLGGILGGSGATQITVAALGDHRARRSGTRSTQASAERAIL